MRARLAVTGSFKRKDGAAELTRRAALAEITIRQVQNYWEAARRTCRGGSERVETGVGLIRLQLRNKNADVGTSERGRVENIPRD